jgi:hypothetical protein
LDEKGVYLITAISGKEIITKFLFKIANKKLRRTMKKKLLNLIAGSTLLFHCVSNAQPILTATGTNPVVGNHFTLVYSNYVSSGNAGANQTWNLSAMTGSSQSISIVNPANTPNGTSFPNSNVTWDLTGTSNYLYYKTSSTALQSYGDVYGTVTTTLSDPEDYLHFPFAYTNTYTDSWAGHYVSNNGYSVFRTGTVTVTADGWGTLTTPNGIYNNTMRVHFLEVFKDSIVGVSNITYNNDEYFWYMNGAPVPIASVYTATSSNGGPYTGGYYVSGTVGIANDFDITSASNLYPNPATDQITINLTLQESKTVSVQLYNEIGQKIERSAKLDGIQGINTIELNVATWPKGIYFAQILLDGNIAATKRFVITK